MESRIQAGRKFVSSCSCDDGIANSRSATKQVRLQRMEVVLGPCLSIKNPINNLDPIAAAKPVVDIRANTSFCLEL